MDDALTVTDTPAKKTQQVVDNKTSPTVSPTDNFDNKRTKQEKIATAADGNSVNSLIDNSSVVEDLELRETKDKYGRSQGKLKKYGNVVVKKGHVTVDEVITKFCNL